MTSVTKHKRWENDMWQKLKSVTKHDKCDKMWQVSKTWQAWLYLKSVTKLTRVTKHYKCDRIWQLWQNMTSVTKHDKCDKISQVWQNMTNVTKHDKCDEM